MKFMVLTSFIDICKCDEGFTGVDCSIPTCKFFIKTYYKFYFIFVNVII